MSYTAQAITNGNGDRAFYMGLDLGNLKPECALGETSPIMKEVVYEKKLYTVHDLMYDNTIGIKYDLILRTMLKDGVVDYDTKVQVGSNGRLREVYLVREKEGYRLFGKTYYGKVSDHSFSGEVSA
jgi:hypothetical protein